MFRFALFCLWVGVCLAQTPGNPAGRPPAAVDEALRARVNQFYQYHNESKFRQAESLVAEESKDLFYGMAKLTCMSFEIRQIDYSLEFSRASVTMTCERRLMLPGFDGKVVKAGLISTWKLEGGLWCWYVDSNAPRDTPFGKVMPTDTGAPGALPKTPTIEQMSFIQNQLKADKEEIGLKAGQSGQVTLSNTASGPLSITLQGSLAGVDVKLDRLDLKSGEKAVLNLKAGPNAQSGTLSVQVEQTNQVIPIQIHIQ